MWQFFGVPQGKSSGSLAWSINMADIDLGSKTEPSKWPTLLTSSWVNNARIFIRSQRHCPRYATSVKLRRSCQTRRKFLSRRWELQPTGILQTCPPWWLLQVPMVGFEMVGQQPATVEKDLDTLSLVNNVPLVSASGISTLFVKLSARLSIDASTIQKETSLV